VEPETTLPESGGHGKWLRYSYSGNLPKRTFRDLVAEMVQSNLVNIQRAIKDGRAI
jgi:hypothetical protein